MVVNGNTAQPGQVAMTITTNAAGVATTGGNALPYGDYTVREVSTNESMLKTFDEEISVTIDSDEEMLEYEAENEVVRGGIDISKEDSEMGSTPQGNSSFAGISFEVVNRSANPVVVGGQTYAVGDVVRPSPRTSQATPARAMMPFPTAPTKSVNPPPTSHAADLAGRDCPGAAEWTFCGGHRRG